MDLGIDTHSLPLAVRFGEGASLDTVRLLFCGLMELDATVRWLTGVKDNLAVYREAFVSVRSIELLDSGEPVLLADFLDDTGDRTGDSVALRFSVITKIEVT